MVEQEQELSADAQDPRHLCDSPIDGDDVLEHEARDDRVKSLRDEWKPSGFRAAEQHSPTPRGSHRELSPGGVHPDGGLDPARPPSHPADLSLATSHVQDALTAAKPRPDQRKDLLLVFGVNAFSE